jgi:phospholipase C
LPNPSIVTTTEDVSQHNSESMAIGDNWIGQVVSSIMHGPDWPSTVIFITWDDCGCFYDHMNPFRHNPEWGIRVPMIMVSPYAKAGYTDRTPATYASMLAFTEHTFGVAPLNPCATQLPDPYCTDDVVGPNGQPMYDFSGAFDWTKRRIGVVRMTTQRISRAERAYLRSIPHEVGNGT